MIIKAENYHLSKAYKSFTYLNEKFNDHVPVEGGAQKESKEKQKKSLRTCTGDYIIILNIYL